LSKEFAQRWASWDSAGTGLREGVVSYWCVLTSWSSDSENVWMRSARPPAPSFSTS
jgi:hypothetical protein